MALSVSSARTDATNTATKTITPQREFPRALSIEHHLSRTVPLLPKGVTAKRLSIQSFGHLGQDFKHNLRQQTRIEDQTLLPFLQIDNPRRLLDEDYFRR